MCGIWLSYNFNDLKEYFDKISNRGPDYHYYKEILDKLFLGFHRLAIIDSTHLDDQPFITETETNIVYVICNGEIYNHKNLKNSHYTQYSLLGFSELKNHNKDYYNTSDCEIIIHLYQKYKDVNYISKMLDAEFAFIIVDYDKINKNLKIMASRDPIGIRPLFYTYNNNQLILSSELKGIPKELNGQVFPPGNTMLFTDNTLQFTPFYFYNFNKKHTVNNDKIVNLFTKAVQKRLIHDDDIELGSLISGGLDSSVVSAVAAKFVKNLKTFTIGFSGGTDIKYAELVTKHIKSDHTTFIVTPDEALNAIDEVIYCIESYDITTIRASVFQYLLAKKIKEKYPKMKVLLTGELSDELMQGYLYFHLNKNAKETFNESIRLIKDVHLFDGLRVDRCVSNFGLECRIPFADLEFVRYMLEHHNDQLKPQKGIEKYLFRNAFAKTGLLPNEVLWRRKEAMSNGTSSADKDWKEYIQEYILEKYNMKEDEYYKMKFIEYFGENNLSIIPYIWRPKWTDVTDPSARILNIYKTA